MDRRRTHLFGVGLPDGHTRITRGDGLTLVGGDEESHELMQEQAIKVAEKLKARGKTLPSTSPREVMETLCEVAESL